MTFYGKGVRQNRHEALELMRKSAYNNNDEYAIKARTVVNHWQNNQVIFLTTHETHAAATRYVSPFLLCSTT